MGHPVQPPCRIRVTYSRLHRTSSRRVLSISREGESTTSLGSLFQCSSVVQSQSTHGKVQATTQATIVALAHWNGWLVADPAGGGSKARRAPFPRQARATEGPGARVTGPPLRAHPLPPQGAAGSSSGLGRAHAFTRPHRRGKQTSSRQRASRGAAPAAPQPE